MKLINKLLFAISVLLFAQLSFAGGPLNSNKITHVAFNSGGFFLYADNWPNRNDCSKSDAVVLQKTDANYDKAYSLVLAAYMSGLKVSGYSDECVTHDGQTYNSIRGTKYLVVSD